jgi:hypothetical protein
VRRAETSLPERDIAAAVDAVATHHAVWHGLAAALASDPDALTHGAPPAVGRLVTELIARGAAILREPRCVVCGRGGRPLTVTEGGGMCKRCAARRDPQARTYCGGVKPVAGRTIDAKPFCEPCRRHRRGHRRCGICGKIASIAVRARDGEPDICVNCYRLPARSATCVGGCGRAPSPPATSRSANSAPSGGHGAVRPLRPRPPTGRLLARRPLILCDPCYTAALRHRGCRQSSA